MTNWQNQFFQMEIGSINNFSQFYLLIMSFQRILFFLKGQIRKLPFYFCGLLKFKIIAEMSTIVKSVQNMSFLSKQNILLKHTKQIKISFIDLTPFINAQFGFIDPDFPHSSSSINQNQQMNHEDIQWLPAQNLHEYANYSDLITNLQMNLFYKKSIGHALTIINWFANVYFGDIFIHQLSNHHLYSYDVMIDGVFMNIPIDSYVPIQTQTRTQMFSKNYKGSIFPCLYQKLLAKIYGDYQSITDDFMDIVELQTLFCRQEISLTFGIQQKFLIETIQNSLQTKSIVSFRTRNSIRLQSFGLQSNSIYIILRLIPKDETYLVQFLQLQGEKWIGKHSKLRSEWLINKQYISQHKIVHSEQFKQNYMLLSDMKGLGRQLTILHNTVEYNKNYYSSQNSHSNLTGYNFSLKERNKVKIRVNYRHKKCYNSIFVIRRDSHDALGGYKLICSSFNENKDYNFEELEIESGYYSVIIYNTHPQEEALPYNITLFTSQEFVELTSINSTSEVLYIFEVIFKNHFISQYQHSNEPIIFKQLYNDTGLSFIFINKPLNKISVEINVSIMKQNKIYLINYSNVSKQNEIKLQFGKEECYLLILKCLWSKKENIVFDYQAINSKDHIEKIMFPPVGSVKVYQKSIKQPSTIEVQAYMKKLKKTILY